MGDGLVDKSLDLILLHHVAGNEQGTVANIKLRDNFATFFRIAGHQCDIGALCQKRFGNPAPDTRRAARDRCCLAAQFPIRLHFSSSPLNLPWAIGQD